MQDKLNWADRPMWVRIALFGVPSRRAAMLWMKGSLAATALLVALCLVGGVALFSSALVGAAAGVVLAVPMLAAPLWYWLAIQFTDDHDGWAQRA